MDTLSKQQVLHDDISKLLREVEAGEFGDFTNEKYDAPKTALVQYFMELIENTKNGKYD